MVTGASTADLALVLVDARHGLTEQSRRHAVDRRAAAASRTSSSCVNKMDLVDFSEERFDARRAATSSRSPPRSGCTTSTFIPICALEGDNVVERSERMPWYGGEPLLAHLERRPRSAATAT